ncbi:MAG: hypothetical protein ACRD0K_02705 [Egibacteraceae bacterium]
MSAVVDTSVLVDVLRGWQPALIVAATAKVLNLDVLTRNVRRFPMFSGLRARTDQSRSAYPPNASAR